MAGKREQRFGRRHEDRRQVEWFSPDDRNSPDFRIRISLAARHQPADRISSDRGCRRPLAHAAKRRAMPLRRITGLRFFPTGPGKAGLGLATDEAPIVGADALFLEVGKDGFESAARRPRRLE